MLQDGWYRATVGVGGLALRAIGLRTSMEGLDHLPAEGPAIVAATHVAYPDFMTLADAGWGAAAASGSSPATTSGTCRACAAR